MNWTLKQKFRRRRLGASLATVMMVVAMMMTLGFTVVAIAFNHLNLSFKSNNHARAKHLAEAVLAQAIDKIVADQEFGTTGTAEEKTIRIVASTNPDELFYSLPSGSEGLLTFDEDLAAAEGIAYSTNNRTESGVNGFQGITVPGESFHLVATARVKNSTSKVEAILTVPKFPFSVAAEGTIRSNGGLTVASVAPNVPYDLAYPIHEDDLRPAHMVSNFIDEGAEGGGIGVTLSGENKIYGDLQSSSGVELEADTAVLGEVRTYAAAEALPIIDVRKYDPDPDVMPPYDPDGPEYPELPDESDVKYVNSGAGTLTVEGYNKSNGDLTVDSGIELNGGVLYVDGNLQVSAGGVTGKGALIATGDIRISGDGEAFSDNEASLIADGNIVLKGTTSEKAKFSGLIYTHGQLDAENLRLAGVFVAAGDSSSVEFTNTEVYQDSSLSVIELGPSETPDSTFELPPLTAPTISMNSSTFAPTSYDTSQLQANIESYRNPNAAPGEPDYLFKLPFTYSSTGFITHRYEADGTVSYVDTTGPDQYVVDGSTLGLTIFGEKVTSLSHAQSVTINGMEALVGRPLSEEEKDDLRAAAKVAFESSSAVWTLSHSSAEHSYDNQSTTNPTDPTGSTDSFSWSIDLSEFFSNSKKIEVVYWAEETE